MRDECVWVKMATESCVICWSFAFVYALVLGFLFETRLVKIIIFTHPLFVPTPPPHPDHVASIYVPFVCICILITPQGPPGAAAGASNTRRPETATSNVKNRHPSRSQRPGTNKAPFFGSSISAIPGSKYINCVYRFNWWGDKAIEFPAAIRYSPFFLLNYCLFHPKFSSLNWIL